MKVEDPDTGADSRGQGLPQYGPGELPDRYLQQTKQNWSTTKFYGENNSSVTIMVEDCILFDLKKVTAEKKIPKKFKSLKIQKIYKCMQMLCKWQMWLPI